MAHAIVDAGIGGVAVDEREITRPLLPSFASGMLIPGTKRRE